MRGHAPISMGRIYGLGYYFILGSTPDSADPIVEVVFLFLDLL